MLAHHFPSTSGSSPGSPTFSHSQSLSLNGAGLNLSLLRPGANGANSPALSLDDTAVVRGTRSYLDFVKSWDDDHVARWLGEVNEAKYADVFRENDIRGNVLLDVDQQALKEMGVRSVGDRVKITVAIKALRQRCVASALSERQGSQSRAGGDGGSNGWNGGQGGSSLAQERRSGLGRTTGRVPPPLHLSQSSSSGSLPQAWQPAATPAPSSSHPSIGGSTNATHYLGLPGSNTGSPGTVSSPRSGASVRVFPPPSLPPPRSQPPPPPTAFLTRARNDAPLPSPPVPSISLSQSGPSSIAATPSSSGSGGAWNGEHGGPRSPIPTGSGGPSTTNSNKGASDRKPSAPSGSQSATSKPTLSSRPSNSQLGKIFTSPGSTPSTGRSGAPSTSNYGHGQSLSTHPYATSNSPTTEGFHNTIYGRPIPASTPSNKTPLLPSPAIGLAPPSSDLSGGAELTRRNSGKREGYSAGLSRTPTIQGGLMLAPSPSSSSLDALMRKAVKFVEEDEEGNGSKMKMISFAECEDGKELLLKVLRKFQKIGPGEEEGAEEWGIYVTSVDGRARLLSDSDLWNISRDEKAPERQGQRTLQVRRIRQASPSKRGIQKMQAIFGETNIPVSSRPGGVSSSHSPTSPNYLGVEIPSTRIDPSSPLGDAFSLFGPEGQATEDDVLEIKAQPSNRGKMNRASTISVMSGLANDWGSASINANPSQTSSASPTSASILSSNVKLRSFQGQRPPSELITTHLTEYFPKAEKNKHLSKQVRQSFRKSMIRRDSQYSIVGTSWEKAPDRHSLSPATTSRFSGSSSGSRASSRYPPPPPPPPPIDKDYPVPAPRFGVPRTSQESVRSNLLLSAPEETAEAEDDLSDLFSSTVVTARRSKRMSMRPGPAGKEPDPSSMLTVDEVTAVLETRRASLASYLSSSEDEEPPDGVGVKEPRPPSIALTLEEPEDTEDEEEEDEDEEGEEEDEEEDEVMPAAASSKPRLKWIKGALIGAGSFGSVYLGMNPMSGSLMAVKQVELPTGNSHNEERKKSMLEALEREIELLKVLQHENIVQYLDSSSDATHLNIFLEYVPGGSVAALLSNYGAFEEALVSKFVRQILTGLQYLHEREIIHRDIKGANILVDNKGGIKISDFGISKKVEDNLLSGAKVHRPSLQGSVYWMAPEVVKQTSYTSKADIWSLGCLVVEMLTGAHPWANLTQMQAIFRIGSSSTPAIPDDISTDADDFLTQTFLIDYTARPSARDLLEHNFFKDPDHLLLNNSQQTPTRETFSQHNSPAKVVTAGGD